MSANGANRRVLVLGLDGATWDLLTPWIDQGHMPNLARVRAEGAWGPLASTIPPWSATAWTTFATGVNPGKHGVFDFWYNGPDGKRLPVDASSIRAPTLWRRLSDAGRRVAVIGVPVTYPPVPVNGVLVSGLLTPPTAPTFTYPPSLAEELRNVAGAYSPDPYTVLAQSVNLLRDALYWLDRHEQAHRYLLSREPWDCFIQVIRASDVIHHYFWTFLRPGHPDYDAPGAAKYRELVLEAYRRMDDIIGHRASQLGPNDVLIVMSDHGAGEATHWFNLNRFLADMGFLTLRNKPTLVRAGITSERILGLLLRLDILGLRNRLSDDIQLKLRKQVDRLVAAPIDWTRTKAYAASASAEAVYLNVRGREPEGIVEPGAEYNQLREEIIHRLAAVRDPMTGAPVFQAVHRREDIYQGPYLDRAPDIILEIGNGPYITTEHLGSTKVLERIPYKASRGRHRPNGILVLYGKPVQGGTCVEGARLLDLAPTILALLGLPVPQEMDGRVLTEFFSSLHFSQAAIAMPAGEVTDKGAGGAETGYSPEEAAWIEDHLRSLGYLD
jgi:predicted AlkP superfamily phosphohydrolase/phosphomutase